MEKNYSNNNNSINIKSFAKVNLRLKIIGRNKDDFHLLELITTICNLADNIILIPNHKNFDEITEIKFSENIYSFNLDTKNNSITSALNLLRQKKYVKNFYDIVLHKNIPAGGGLGGGSANAAFIILKFLENKNVYDVFTNHELNKMGTDLHCFFNKSNLIFQENIGDKVKSLNLEENLEGKEIILFFPKILSSSPLMYQKFREEGHFSKKEIINQTLSYSELIQLVDNDFLDIFLKNNPQINDFYNQVNSLKLGTFSLSGSGSTFFLLPKIKLSQENLHKISNICKTFAIKTVSANFR